MSGGTNQNNKTSVVSDRQQQQEVTVDLTNHDPSAPLGLLLAPSFSPSQQQNASLGGGVLPSTDEAEYAIVAGWERLPNGKFGPVQKCGCVRIGDRLVRVNHLDVTAMSFRTIMNLLKLSNGSSSSQSANNIVVEGRGGGGLKSLTFVASSLSGRQHPSQERPQQQHQHQHCPQIGSTEEGDMFNEGANSTRPPRRYIFQSNIRRVRINDPAINRSSRHNNPISTSISVSHNRSSNRSSRKQAPFVEYEVVCHLIIRWNNEHLESMKIGSNGIERRWSVWRRYSEFRQLDQHLRAGYQWQIDAVEGGVPFPSRRSISSLFHGLSPDFVDQRRKELQSYWKKILSIEQMTDFEQSHRYSKHLAAFLSIEQYLDFHIVTTGASLTGNRPMSLSHALERRYNVEGEEDGEGEEQDGKEDENVQDGQQRQLQHQQRGNSLVPDDPPNIAMMVAQRKRIPAKSMLQRRIPGTTVSIMMPPSHVK